MVSKSFSLKALNSPVVFLFSAWSLSLLLVCCFGSGDFWGDLQERFASLNAKDGMLLALSPLVSLVAAGLLPPDIKAMLLFWRTKHVLPGHRAFSVHAENDSRVEIARLRASLDRWPSTPEEENSVWYRLYKPIQHEANVAEAHRKFLLSRDLTTSSWVFLLLGVPIAFALGSTYWSAVSFGILMFVHIFLFTFVGRNEAVRFVKNVLVHVCATTDVPQQKLVVV